MSTRTEICRVGGAAPDFDLPCVDIFSPDIRRARLRDYAGSWLILIFYPRDFSFVCPTELTSFSARSADFTERNCALLGISVDTIELHAEWLATPASEGGLGPLQFPLASDSEGGVAAAFGVWLEEKELSTRGLFLIDPEGVLQYAVAHNLSVGRNVDEVLRVLDALQTGGLCPASWTQADGTIDPEKALRPGRVLGHYRIRQALGSGTFGSVFAAVDLRLERPVALKVLKRKTTESREDLLVEARAAARLNHPNVCTVFAVEEEDGLPLIAMELVGGESLAAAINTGRPLSDAARIAAGIAAAMAEAHKQDVVHGDLKPANILLTAQREPKIVDFGLSSSWRRNLSRSGLVVDSSAGAAAADALEPQDATVDLLAATAGGDLPSGAAVHGTPAYMSPEQSVGQPPIAASDVFSFGLVLYEMLTGRKALAGDSIAEIIARLDDRQLADSLSTAVPAPYRRLLAAALAHAPHERPPMDEIAALLRV